MCFVSALDSQKCGLEDSCIILLGLVRKHETWALSQNSESGSLNTGKDPARSTGRNDNHSMFLPGEFPERRPGGLRSMGGTSVGHNRSGPQQQVIGLNVEVCKKL